jgi:hypothetical protein
MLPGKLPRRGLIIHRRMLTFTGSHLHARKSDIASRTLVDDAPRNTGARWDSSGTSS